MDIKGFSVPYQGDQEAARKAAEKHLAAWLKRYPAARVLDRWAMQDKDTYVLMIAHENRYAVGKL